ncbi:aldehyde dehydrogenase family protein [Sneathiella chungangensis]|uniref:Aldehyde dehydrogenase family protein n=1 Tax=Sneathiella chungangensis TaxID=1418234 RepID=A0A845MJC0_9PROT|nr:aldehyde dehydrogenase family protein [Sneathiella chungangensis]MZR23929.1 aldehyde dehydrogenase family protein [Sneathiella chungangensis]
MDLVQINHFIGGQEVGVDATSRFETINPSNGKAYASVAHGDASDVDTAVANCAQTFAEGAWSKMPPAERSAVLSKIGDIILTRINFLALLESRDSGKPIINARRDVMRASSLMKYFATLPEIAIGANFSEEPGYHSYSTRVPFSVVGSIVPWNLPFLFAAWKSAPAIALGSSVVLKPSEETSASAIEFARICIDAGLPPGVVNVVLGDGKTGAALVDHPKVEMISFTGSTYVGRKILQAASSRLKGVHLELGGKSANIVFADADLDKAVEATLFSSYWNTGQICTSGTRLLLADEIADEFIKRLSVRLRDADLVGDPSLTTTQIGPVISKRQFEKVQSYISLAVEEGAELVFGGNTPTIKDCEDGFFINPTLFKNASPKMRVAQEEIFGPVTVAMTFSSESEAVEIANSTQFGLAAAIWTQDIARAHRIAEQLTAGIIWTNCINRIRWNIPYEGHGVSGMGEDLGVECIKTFSKLKVNQINFSGNPNVSFPVSA